MNRICKQCVQRNPTSGYCPKKGYEVDEDQAACACFNAVPPSKNLPDDQAAVLPKAPASAAPKEKTCRECGRTLPLDQFQRHAVSKDGYLSICKECQKEKISKSMKRRGGRKKPAEAKQGGAEPAPAAPEPMPIPARQASTCTTTRPASPVSYSVTNVDTLRSISDDALLEELKNRGFSGRITRLVEYNI